MARPTKYSEAMQNAICERLKIGCTRTAAAESLGISRVTFYEWFNHNLTFSNAVTRAEADAEAMFTSTITKAARGSADVPGDWRAAESWLKRRRRNEWGDNLSVSADREVTKLLSELFPDDTGDGIGTPPLGIEA